MDLMEEEREWAQDIKEYCARGPELEPLSDYMYAQWAVVTMTEPPEALNLVGVAERIRNYQRYLQDHRIQDSISQS